MSSRPSFILSLAFGLAACGGAPAPAPVSPASASVSPALAPVSPAPVSSVSAPAETPKTEIVEPSADTKADDSSLSSGPPDDQLAVDKGDTAKAESEVVADAAPFKASKADYAQCAPAIQVLVDLTATINSSIHKHMRKKRRQLIKKCKKRLANGDRDFHRDLLCVANSENTGELVNCQGWTDWPAM